MDWYEIKGIDSIDSPSLAVYEDRMLFNLEKMITMVEGNTDKLMPHVKTNKMPKVIAQMIALGIKKFKTSTIAEAEIAAIEGASNVLIAHQLVGPKIQRFIKLIENFPNTQFATIVDNIDTVNSFISSISEKKRIINVYIDINSGMNRSGIEIGSKLDKLLLALHKSNKFKFKGLHIYDGHLRNPDFKERKKLVEREIKKSVKLFEALKQEQPDIEMICGGTPTFTSHLSEDNRICSPGTCVFWDYGYDEKLTEQEFKFAALVISRVISKPAKGIITIDLGHKAIGAENPIDKRVIFLNIKNYKLRSQSEEHGVIQIENWDNIQVGDVLYGIPYHICPTINLYDTVSVIRNGKKVANWSISARQRKITI